MCTFHPNPIIIILPDSVWTAAPSTYMYIYAMERFPGPDGALIHTWEQSIVSITLAKPEGEDCQPVAYLTF